MAIRCPNSIGSGVERTGGCADRFRPHEAESSGTPKTIQRSVRARQCIGIEALAQPQRIIGLP